MHDPIRRSHCLVINNKVESHYDIAVLSSRSTLSITLQVCGRVMLIVKDQNGSVNRHPFPEGPSQRQHLVEPLVAVAEHQGQGSEYRSEVSGRHWEFRWASVPP